MTRLHAWFWRLLGLFQKGKRDAEMAEEIQQHLDGLTERNLAAGMSPNEARSAALKRLTRSSDSFPAHGTHAREPINRTESRPN